MKFSRIPKTTQRSHGDAPKSSAKSKADIAYPMPNGWMNIHVCIRTENPVSVGLNAVLPSKLPIKFCCPDDRKSKNLIIS